MILDDARRARSLGRLVRFAGALLGPDAHIAPRHFEVEVHGAPLCCLLLRAEFPFQLGDVVDLRRVVVNRGPLLWTLRPLESVSLARLSRVVKESLLKSCAGARLTLSRKVCRRAVRYRFVLRAGDHAHTGVLAFDGPQVERTMQAGRTL